MTQFIITFLLYVAFLHLSFQISGRSMVNFHRRNPIKAHYKHYQVRISRSSRLAQSRLFTEDPSCACHVKAHKTGRIIYVTFFLFNVYNLRKMFCQLKQILNQDTYRPLGHLLRYDVSYSVCRREDRSTAIAVLVHKILK